MKGHDRQSALTSWSTPCWPEPARIPPLRLQGPACTPVPATIPIRSTAPFTISVYVTVDKVQVPLTPQQLLAVFPTPTSIRTVWAYEESFIKFPTGLNSALPAC
jgi:hypothetical protein